MRSSSSVKILRLPRLSADTHNADDLALAYAYRDLRLLALRTNPEAFGSSYEVEVERGIEQTLHRLNDPKAATFIAVRDDTDVETISSAFWLGSITLIGPQNHDGPAVPAQRGSPSETDPLRFTLQGVFVRPESRGLGVGKRLMAAALREAEAQCRACSYSQFVCGVQVDTENDAARALYESAGFVQIGQEKYVQQPREVEPGVLRSTERLANCLELHAHLD